MNDGSNLIKALETAYADIRKRHPELNDVVFITGTGRQGRRSLWGRYSPDRWADEDKETYSEILIAGERMADGAEGVLETILHEAAHNLASVRQVKDTSRQGRYHNKTFAGIANELGLTTPEKADERLGFSSTDLTDETRQTYAKTIERLQTQINLSLPGALQAAETAGTTSSSVKLVCDCGFILRASKKVAEFAESFVCKECNSSFQAE